VRLDHSQSVEKMLVEGELDAVLHSDLIQPLIDKDPRVARLFPNYREEEVNYFKRTGIFPIMHVMGIKQELLEQHPWIAINMYQAFQKSKAIGMARMENPRIVPLAWYREEWEEQEELMGSDPWEFGLSESNRHNLDTLAGYSFEQGLIRTRPALEDLFVDVSQGRKRDVARI
jgi:4,5-dihydroxyphthalate decarboxylase